LNHIDKCGENNSLLEQIPKTPQQTFLLSYAAIYFINKGCNLPILNKILENKSGSYSELMLRLKYMKQCLEAKVDLDNKHFHVLSTLVLWMEELKKISKQKVIKLVPAILLPHPSTLKFEHYE
jgi:hypothetical protein